MTTESIHFEPSKQTKDFYKALKTKKNNKQYTEYDLDKAVDDAYLICIETAKSALSNWSTKTPEKMAEHCVKLLELAHLRRGITPKFSRQFINELKVKGKLR